MAKIKPITVIPEEASELTKQIQTQDLSTGIPQSLDPEFPMFKYTTLGRHLLYFPNIDVENQNPDLGMLMDITNTVGVRIGATDIETAIRNTQGMKTKNLEANGVSGDSPLQAAYELRQQAYGLIKDRKFKEMGIDPSHKVDMKDSSDPAVGILQGITKDLPIGRQREMVITPVIDIALDANAKGIKPFVDPETKKITTTVGWLAVSPNAYEKLVKTINNSENGKGAGEFFIFDYTSEKINENDPSARMKSALGLSISITNIQGLEKAKPGLDEKAKDWDLTRLRNTVTMATFLSDEEVSELVEPARLALEDIIETEKNLADPTSTQSKAQIGTANSKETPQIETKSTEEGLESFSMEEVNSEEEGIVLD